jgi:hypothetical protein
MKRKDPFFSPHDYSIFLSSLMTLCMHYQVTGATMRLADEVLKSVHQLGWSVFGRENLS